MALDAKVVNFTKVASPSTQNVVAVGFPVKFAIVFATMNTSDGFASDFYSGIAVANSSAQSGISGSSEDDNSVADTDRTSSTSNAIRIRPHGGSDVARGTISFSGNDLVIDWSPNDAFQYVLSALCLGGADLSDIDIGDEASEGFPPQITTSASDMDALIALGQSTTNLNQTVNYEAGEFGFATRNPLSQVSTAGRSQHNASPSNTARVLRTDRALIGIDGFAESLARAAEIASWSGTTISLTYHDSPRNEHFSHWAALKGMSVALVTGTQLTQGQFTDHDVGFAPKAVIATSVNRTPSTLVTGHNRRSFGLSDNITEFSHWVGDTDAVGTMSANSYVDQTAGLTMVDTDNPTVEDGQASISFTGNFVRVSWNISDGVGREYALLVFGDAPGAAGQTLSPTAIGSAESFGSLTLAVGATTLTSTAIASLESFGSPTITTGAVGLSPTAIASAEAFGTPQLDFVIFPTAIGSVESFGSPTLATGPVTITATAIASVESFGNHSVVLGGGTQTLVTVAIGSAESFGSPTLTVTAITLSPTAIASLESFGTPSMIFVVAPTGVASLESFGSPTLAVGAVTISPTGIATLEAFGVPTIALVTGAVLTPYGAVYRLLNIADYPSNATFKFEAIISSGASPLPVEARLYEVSVDGSGNVTQLGQIGPSLSTTNVNPTRLRTASLALPSGDRLYRVEFGGPSGTTYSCEAADIIVEVP